MSEHNIFRISDPSLYRQWIAEFDTLQKEDLAVLEAKLATLLDRPFISILPLSTMKPQAAEFQTFERGLEMQLYRNWRIYSNVDAISDVSAFSELILKAAKTADFVLPLPLDATLPIHALAEFALTLAKAPEADMIYADEDFLQDGLRSQPHFKTDWDAFIILGCNSVGSPTLYRSTALERAGLEDLNSTTLDNFLHSMTVRISQSIPYQNILHIPAILCHRRQKSDWNGEEARRLINAHLARNEFIDQAVSPAPLAPHWSRVKTALPAPLPQVSIIVPTRDRGELIGPCVNGLLRLTDYLSFELIIIDNGTTEPAALAVLDEAQSDPRVRLLRDTRPFNYSQLNNTAAASARGDILVLLNNDMEIIQGDWLNELVSLISRPDVGAAGAKLLYPDMHVQHAGISFGPDKNVLHQMRGAKHHEAGPHGELCLLRSVSALTGACLAIRRDLFLELGGFNEEMLKVACNDIDLCRRVAKLGLAIVWTPFAELIHHESVTRGRPSTPDRADREATELMAFWAMHPEFYDRPDPFHNPQIEFKDNCVDFARPPRSHPFRNGRREHRVAPFLY